MRADATAGMQKTTGPVLSGLRVLDFGRYIAAPYCSHLLANEGAEVIRVEPPEGATDRVVMPVGIEGRGGLYLQVNNNKKSLTLDFSTEAGRAVLERLIATTDIVVVNVPHAALHKLGLDYESLCKIKPDIILTSISAFDASGRDRDRVGFDGTGQALSGSMYLTGDGQRPTRAAVSYVDYATAMSAAFATMTAVIERMKTGQGQHVSCSLMGTALTMMNPMLMEEASGYRSRKPMGNRSPIAGPSDLYAATDGWVMVQVIGDAMFRRWANLMGMPELVDDPRYATDSDRGENGEELSRIMADWCKTRTFRQCLDELSANRVPACRCLTPADTLNFKGFDDYVEDLSVSDDGKPLPLVARSIHTRSADSTDRRMAPELGADTVDLLKALEMGEDDIKRLKADGIV